MAHSASGLVSSFTDRGTTHWCISRPWQAARPANLAATVAAGWRDSRHFLRRFFAQANGLEHVGPFPTLAGMAVFEMLSEMIGSVEFFGLVALAKLVHVGEVVDASVPIRLWAVRKFLSTEAAGVCQRAVGSLRRRVGGRVECGFVTRNGGARPRVPSKMQRVLVSLGFILVFEAIVAVLTGVLLLHLMRPGAVELGHVFIDKGSKRNATMRNVGGSL